MLPTLLASLQLACAPPGAGGPAAGGVGGGGSPPDTGSPFAELGPGPTPTWPPGAFGGTVDAALAGGIPHPHGLRVALAAAMDHAGGGCPRYEDPGTTTGLGTWFADGCAAGGWTYAGLAVFSERHGPDAWDFGGIASFEITDPQGAVFIGGGDFGHERTVAPSGTITLDSHIGGTYQAPWAGGWAAAGVDVGIWVAGQRGEGAAVTTVDGGLMGPEGALYFDGMTRDPAVCGGLPQGGLRLRDPSGGWYAVALAGCSGCGVVTWAGDPVGESCPGPTLSAAFDSLEATAWAP